MGTASPKGAGEAQRCLWSHPRCAEINRNFLEIFSYLLTKCWGGGGGAGEAVGGCFRTEQEQGNADFKMRARASMGIERHFF